MRKLEFKILLFVFKAMNGLPPKYLSGLLKLNNYHKVISKKTKSENHALKIVLDGCGNH